MKNKNQSDRVTFTYPIENDYNVLPVLGVDSKKWTQPVHNWGLTIQQLCIKFGDRMKIEL